MKVVCSVFFVHERSQSKEKATQRLAQNKKVSDKSPLGFNQIMHDAYSAIFGFTITLFSPINTHPSLPPPKKANLLRQFELGFGT